jgi:short-subunit dehydrogenase
MQLAGKTVLVTGASSGIGAATARLVAEHGARVLLVARDSARLHQVAESIRANRGQAQPYSVDLADPAAITTLARRVESRFGTPDVLINNAGAGRWRSVQETDSAQLQHMMAVPYFAAFNLTRELLSGMRQRGNGQIINLSSVGSRMAWPGAAAYLAARWALMGFNEALRAELRGTGIAVTLVILGKVRSEYWQHNPGSEGRLPRIASLAPTLAPQQAAATILTAIQRQPRVIVRPRMARMFLLLNSLFPRPTEYLLCATGWSPHNETAGT